MSFLGPSAQGSCFLNHQIYIFKAVWQWIVDRVQSLPPLDLWASNRVMAPCYYHGQTRRVHSIRKLCRNGYQVLIKLFFLIYLQTNGGETHFTGCLLTFDLSTITLGAVRESFCIFFPPHPSLFISKSFHIFCQSISHIHVALDTLPRFC